MSIAERVPGAQRGVTAVQRVRHAQRMVGGAAVAQAVGWGIASALAAVALVSFVSIAIPSLADHSAMFRAIALVIGFAVTGALLWRSRRFVSSDRVALWIEERVPRLEYSLVTALEHPASPFAAGMEEMVAANDISGATRIALRRPMTIAAAALITAFALLYAAPSGAFVRGASGAAFREPGIGPRGSVRNRLDAIEARITPPAYAGERPTTLSNPSSIGALTGSAIVIRGIGSTAGLSAALMAGRGGTLSTTLGDTFTPTLGDARTATLGGSLRISGGGAAWSVHLVMPPKPAALRLADGNYERIIVLTPRLDARPRVVLNTPAHDTALRTPRFVVQLAATATDDIGLASGRFEYLITSGSGEIFRSRTINTLPVRFNGSRSGTLVATLDLSSLGLAEGDVVSMRALVQDGNSVGAAGVSSSDTRTIRIVRAGEYDSLAVEAAAPPPLDTSVVSQRMLIAMTEQLVRDKPGLARPILVTRSTDIADLEDRVRGRVAEILAGGERTPSRQPAGSMAATLEQMEAPEENNGRQNTDLKTAYNALWEAVRSLRIAEPAAALPPMRIALAALDRARLANRYYLRGTPPRIIVDLRRVRLTGKEKGSSNVRTPRSVADSARLGYSARFDAALELIDKNPARALSELALLRVDALSSLPAFAAALGEASDAIRGGRDATLPLSRARRALQDPPEITPALSPWSGGRE